MPAIVRPVGDERDALVAYLEHERHVLVVREHRATFSVAPDAPPRPGPRTALRGFYLACDWTDTGLPGTIESAVVSGHLAADAVLEQGR